jgi:hypothetical protein
MLQMEGRRHSITRQGGVREPLFSQCYIRQREQKFQPRQDVPSVPHRLDIASWRAKAALRLLRLLRHVPLMTFRRLCRASVDAVAVAGVDPSTAGDRAN